MRRAVRRDGPRSRRGGAAVVPPDRVASPSRPPVRMTDDSTEPIRAELLSVERLERLATDLARRRVADHARPTPAILARMRENGRVLLRCYRTLAAVIDEERTTTPAAEWLVDNFHIVEDALNEVRADLPAGFYRLLPMLAEGPLRDAPRVMGLGWAFVAHTDSRFEAA